MAVKKRNGMNPVTTPNISNTKIELENKTDKNLEKLIQKINCIASFQILFLASGLSENKDSFENIRKLTLSLTTDREISPQKIWHTFYINYGKELNHWTYFKTIFVHYLLCETEILSRFISAYSHSLVDNLRKSFANEDGILRYGLTGGLLKDFHQLLVDQNEAVSQKKDLSALFSEKDERKNELRGKDLYKALGASYVDYFTPKEMGSFFLNSINSILRRLLKYWVIPWTLEKIFQAKTTTQIAYQNRSPNLPEYYQTQILISITSIVRQKIDEMAERIGDNVSTTTPPSLEEVEEELIESDHDKLLSNITKEILYTHFVLDETITKERLEIAKNKSAFLVSCLQKEIGKVSDIISEQLQNQSLYEELFSQIFEKVDQDLSKEADTVNIASLKKIYYNESKEFRKSALNLSLKTLEPIFRSVLLIDYEKERKSALDQFQKWHQEQFLDPIKISKEKAQKIGVLELTIKTSNENPLDPIESLLNDIDIQLQGARVLSEENLKNRLSFLKLPDQIEWQERVIRNLRLMNQLYVEMDQTIEPPKWALSDLKQKFIELTTGMKTFAIIQKLDIQEFEGTISIEKKNILNDISNRIKTAIENITTHYSSDDSKEGLRGMLWNLLHAYQDIEGTINTILTLEERQIEERALEEKKKIDASTNYFTIEGLKAWFSQPLDSSSDPSDIIGSARSRSQSTESTDDSEPPRQEESPPSVTLEKQINDIIKELQKIKNEEISKIEKKSIEPFFLAIKNFEHYLNNATKEIEVKPSLSIAKKTKINITNVLSQLSSTDTESELLKGITSGFLSFQTTLLLEYSLNLPSLLKLLPITLILVFAFGKIHRDLNIKNNRYFVDPLTLSGKILTTHLTLLSFLYFLSTKVSPVASSVALATLNATAIGATASFGQKSLLNEGMKAIQQEIKPAVKTLQTIASKPEVINRLTEIAMRQFVMQFPANYF